MDKSSRQGNSSTNSQYSTRQQQTRSPPAWNILNKPQSLDVDSDLRSSRESRTHYPSPQAGVNEPGLTYIASEAQLIRGSSSGYGRPHTAERTLMDTLQYSVDTLPPPPGSGSAVAAGDAFPIAPPLSDSGSGRPRREPPGVSALRGADSHPSLPNPKESQSAAPRSVITGGGMTLVRNDLFQQHSLGARDGDNVRHGQDEAQSLVESPQYTESRVRFNAPAKVSQPLSDPSSAVRAPSMSREQLIRERGKQHARDLWKEKHQNPAMEGSQSARSERRRDPIDGGDDASTVMTARSNYSHHSAFPQEAGPTEAVDDVDERTRRRNKKKGDLIEISFADKSSAGDKVTASSPAPSQADASKEEARRMAKFEMMRKKKMEEAAEREKVG